MTVSARMKCNLVSSNLYQDYKTKQDEPSKAKKIVLNAVYANDPNDPNYSYSEATPSGELMLWITNPNAYGYFEQGKTYDITIKEHLVT